jgi:hypothetical protein
MAVSYKFSIPKVEKIEQISGKENVLSNLTYAVQAQSTEYLENTILLTKELELNYNTLESFTEYSDLTFDDLLLWVLESQSVDSVEEIDIVAEAIAKIKSLDFEMENKTIKKEYNISLGVHRNIVE